MKKHTAKMKNTDQRCVVVFMQLPESPEHALVIPTDHLPPLFGDALNKVLESPEGQNTPVLAHVLGRRLMPDGTSMLAAFHEAGFLTRVAIDNVVMMPKPNMPFPLRDIIKSMGGTVPMSDSVSGEPARVEENKFNQHTANQQANGADQNRNIALNLLAEAGDLESIARSKREKAYSHDPSLRPRSVDDAPLTPFSTHTLADDQTTSTPVQVKNTRSVQRRSNNRSTGAKAKLVGAKNRSVREED